MPRIDPKVACHRLNVNPIMRYVAQWRRPRSLEKAEAAKAIVEGLVQTKFIKKINNIECLSNIVLVIFETIQWELANVRRLHGLE
jgi:hypothetical protein